MANKSLLGSSLSSSVTIRLMNKEDVEKVSSIHRQAFLRQMHSHKWIECNFNAFPRFLIYVAQIEESIIAYIIWNQKSGFRPEAVLELEQIAVLNEYQGQGVGKVIIEDSLTMVKTELANHDAVLKHILISTRADNQAQQLYADVLGAKIEATISNLYSADEVLMVARDV